MNHTVKQQIKETMIEKYGNASPLKCEEIMDRKNITCEERYGDKDIMHNSAIFEKVVKNSFKKKEYTLPSGKTIVYQGYENVALDELLKRLDTIESFNDAFENYAVFSKDMNRLLLFRSITDYYIDFLYEFFDNN